MNKQELTQQAHDLIEEKINNNETVTMSWAVHELIMRGGEIEGDGCPFYTLCAREYVYSVVKKAVNKYDQREADTEMQMTLDGFDYVQCAYTFKRDGERQLIPIDLCTVDELESRAKEFDAQSEALAKHALELREYIKLMRLKTAAQG